MTAAGATREKAGDATRDASPRGPAPRPRPWLRVAIVAAALLFVGLLAYGLISKAPEGGIEERLASGEAAPAPGFELPVLKRGDPGPELAGQVSRATADGRLSLDELRGTPVVLNFWASWCEPCRTEAGVLERGWDEGRGRGTLFVGLNTQDLTGDARRFMAEFDTSYLNVRDGSNAAAIDWGVTGLPETFFLSRDGDVVAHVIGAVSREQLEAGLQAAQKGRPLGTVEGGDRRSVR